MDEQARLTLKQKYAVLPDEELTAMIAAGKEEFEMEAYDLLLAEARRRGIETSSEAETLDGKEGIPDRPDGQSAAEEDQLQTFVQLIIVVNDSDRHALESLLDRERLPYYMQALNIRGKEWPMALMVEQSRFEDAIELLSQRFKPTGSLILW